MTSLLNTVKSYITTINDTPFVKDVNSGGLLNGLVGGTERERLRYVVANLKAEHELGANIEYLLRKYDAFSESFTRREIVENWRNRLIKATIGREIDEELHDKEILQTETELKSIGVENMQLYLYVIKLASNKYIVSTTDDLKKIPNNTDTIEKVSSPHDELTKVYELMGKYGVANVRGSRYQEWKINLNEATELIKTVTYLNGYILVVDKNNVPDKTVIETFMLLRNGFTVDEIAEMKSLLPSTIQCHLDKSIKVGLRLEKYFESTNDNIEYNNHDSDSDVN